jgi:hypothetical protein
VAAISVERQAGQVLPIGDRAALERHPGMSAH